MLCLHASALPLLLLLPLLALFPLLWPPLPIHAVLRRAPGAAVFVAVDVGNAAAAVKALAIVCGGCRGHARACSYCRSRGCSFFTSGSATSAVVVVGELPNSKVVPVLVVWPLSSLYAFWLSFVKL